MLWCSHMPMHAGRYRRYQHPAAVLTTSDSFAKCFFWNDLYKLPNAESACLLCDCILQLATMSASATAGAHAAADELWRIQQRTFTVVCLVFKPGNDCTTMPVTAMLLWVEWLLPTTVKTCGCFVMSQAWLYAVCTPALGCADGH